MRKVDFKKIRGVTVWVACDYCKEKCRVPGGKYRDQGEVIDCPCCDGRGMTPSIVNMDQFHALMTMTSKGVKTRPWKAKAKPASKRTRTTNS